MKVLVMGSDGRQGKRYCSIIENSVNNKEVLRHDFLDDETDLVQKVKDAYAVIIATPTHLHEEHLRLIGMMRGQTTGTGLRVLMEKPAAMTLDGVKRMRKFAKERCLDLCMVNQYQYALEHAATAQGKDPEEANGTTFYDYYMSGTDGLAWDCIQLIGLAKGRIKLSNQSPVWRCAINGIVLNRSDIDQSYVDMIMDFLGPRYLVWRAPMMEKVTRKVLEYEEQAGSNSHSGQK